MTLIVVSVDFLLIQSFQERYENIEKENLELEHKYDEIKKLCDDQVVKIGMLEKKIEEKEKKCVEVRLFLHTYVNNSAVKSSKLELYSFRSE